MRAGVAGEPIQIVSGAAHRHAMPEVSADNHLGRAGNRVDPSEKGPAQQGAANYAEHRGEAYRPEEGGGDRLLQIAYLPQIGTDREQHAAAELGNQSANPFGPPAILGRLGHLDRGPTRLKIGPRWHLPRKMPANLILYEIVKSAGALPARPHHVDQMSQAISLELLAQERRLGLDSGRHLLLQRRSRFQE